MSSTYRAVCLSHDPGLIVESPETGDRTVIEAWVAKGGRAAQFPGHTRCDLVAGRYSYPLIGAWCPGGIALPDAGVAQRCAHADGWVPVEVLRALVAVTAAHAAAAQRSAEAPSARAAAMRDALTAVQTAAGPCWTVTRIRRLLASEDG